MSKLRDELDGPVTLDYLANRFADGWKLKAMEWERHSEAMPAPQAKAVASPYGLAVVPNTARLETQPTEIEVLQTVLELIVVEKGVSQIANELNQRGYLTRSGKPWTSTAVFNLLPRLIETAPDILKDDDWQARRKKAVS